MKNIFQSYYKTVIIKEMVLGPVVDQSRELRNKIRCMWELSYCNGLDRKWG